LMSSLMGADELTESVPGLMVLAACKMALMSVDVPFDEIEMGTLTIKPLLPPLLLELELEELGECTISISASVWDPLYVCSDGA